MRDLSFKELCDAYIAVVFDGAVSGMCEVLRGDESRDAWRFLEVVCPGLMTLPPDSSSTPL